MPTFKRADQEQIEKAKDFFEAGPEAEMGFAKSLFFGRLKLDDIIPYPMPDPRESDRVEALIKQVSAFLKAHVDPDRIDAEERIPASVIDGLGKLGVLGMTVPPEYGGGGFSHTAYCRVLEHVARHCASTAVLIGAHQSIGLKALVLLGNEEQKRRFLPDLAIGKKLAAFCLSEPDVGSDAASVQTRAVLNADGKTWILNGHKKFATNAALAGMMTVMAQTALGENGASRDRVTAFIVTPDMPGFEVIQSNRSKCGIRGSWQGTLQFTNMPVPAANILGQLGRGLKTALGTLDYGRCTLCAGCLGGARKALESAVERARTRKQFGRPIGQFGLIKQKIARMAETVFAIDALTYLAAGMVDRHAGDLMLETSIAKLFCSEGLWHVVDDAVQIWGGEGYMRENGLERMLRDARINRIVEGTTEVMTAFIALVGMKGVGEEFERVLHYARHPVGNVGRLAQFARGQWNDIIVGAHCNGVRPELHEEGATLARLTHHFARDVSRLLRTFKQDILDMQLIHDRVAWAATELLAISAVLSKLQAMLEAGSCSPRDLVVGKGFCHHAADRIEVRLNGLFENKDREVLAVADALLGLDGAIS
jgi:acyl-CoA dehydrogenase family protein 9